MAFIPSILYLDHLLTLSSYNTQTEKYRRIEAGEDAGSVYGKGFIDSGLWAYSRRKSICLDGSVMFTLIHFDFHFDCRSAQIRTISVRFRFGGRFISSGSPQRAAYG